MNESIRSTLFSFGNHQRGIVVRCIDPKKGLHVIIYRQNQLKLVMQYAFCKDGKWHLSEDSGKVIRESEFPDLVRALNKGWEGLRKRVASKKIKN